MTTEQQTSQHVYEFDVIVNVKGAKKGDEAKISREYVSTTAPSAEAASKEIWNSVNSDTLARMKPVQDGR